MGKGCSGWSREKVAGAVLLQPALPQLLARRVRHVRAQRLRQHAALDVHEHSSVVYHP